MYRVALGMALVLFLAIAGCSSESNSESETTGRTEASILGVYENNVDNIGVELKAGGKATLFDEGSPYEASWERAGADRIVIHGADGVRLTYKFNSDGNLSDDMGLGSVLRKK